MAELARFCLEPGRGPYVWWQGEAWAGKSALLSAFVLDPPAAVRERTEIVSFFITGRLASQDNRETFTTELLLQLAQLTSQALPDGAFTEGVLEGYMLGLLAEAARACQESGKRLVLILDGLDEDQSVTGDWHANSIAALLPAEPPSGMRVIVSARSNTPVPNDVPGWHPMRDPAIVRPLLVSEHARDIRMLSERELTRLLDGNPAERDLLGMLTAARGGLSQQDLAELTSAKFREIKKILTTVAGRTFMCRASLLAPGTRPDVYLLGHEDLQSAASRELREDLAGYCARIHTWAEGYRKKGWPSETPEYLLGGYFQLLGSLGDLTRMTAHATDQARHDRMLELTGADSAALAEIRITLDRIAAQDTTGLADALALAVRRDYLADRNVGMPANLPAVWVSLGRVARAEALAYSITEPRSRALALAKVARALPMAGHPQEASALAEAAEAQTRLFTDAYERAQTLVETAEALAQAGQHRNAESVARSIDNPLLRAQALAHVAAALVKSGQHQDAAILADAVEEQVNCVGLHNADQEMAEVAWTLGAAGLHQNAAMIERSIANEEWQPEVPARLAVALARAGQYKRAESAALSITDSYWQARALTEIVKSLAEAGDREHAEAVACSVISHPPPWRVEALTYAVRAWGTNGKQQRALSLAEQAVKAARSIRPTYEGGRALKQVAGALAEIGQHEFAATIAQEAATKSAGLLEDVADIAQVLAEAGDRRHAAAFAERAEAVARSDSASHRYRVSWDGDIRRIADRLAEVRRGDAETVACLISSRRERTEALLAIARTLAEAGDRHRAAAIAERAEADARSAGDWGPEFQTLAAAAFAWVGNYEHAEALARSIANPKDQVLALTQISAALASTGDHDRAATAAGRAATAARSAGNNPGERALSLAQAARALGNAGSHHRAAKVAAAAEKASRGLGLQALGQVAEILAGAGAHQQVTAIAARLGKMARATNSIEHGDLASAAYSLARAGAHKQAAAIAAHAEALARTTSYPDATGHVKREVVRALAEVGMHQRAVEFARSISPQQGQANLLAEIAVTLARSGSRQSTEVAANLISQPDLPSARDLASLSEELFKAGATDMARRLAIVTCAAGWRTAGVWTLGSWTEAARPILLLDPSVAPVAVNALKHWIAKPDFL